MLASYGVTNLNETYILGDKSLDKEDGTWYMEASWDLETGTWDKEAGT